MPPKSSISKADADLQLVIGVIHQLLPNGNANGKVDFANLAAYLDSGKPHSARMRWNRFIQRVDWGTGTMIDTAAAVTGEVGNNAGESSNPKKELKDKKEKKGGKAGVKRVRDNKDGDIKDEIDEDLDGNLEDLGDLSVKDLHKKQKTKDTEN